VRALVTGGAGFIGSNVVGLLLQRGHEVLVLDDLSSGYRDNLRPEATFREADVRDADTLRTVAAGCSAIFHLAASVGNKRSIDDPRHDAEVNLVGMVSVLEAARANSIDKVVFSSSAGIFGELKTLPIDEDHPQDPDSPYGVSKLAAEKLALVYNKLYGMHNVCLRYFNVYGPHQRFDAYGNVIPIFADRILKRVPMTIFGDGEQTRDFVNVADVAAANLAAAFTPGVSGVFNIGSGGRITVNDLARVMQQVSGIEVGVEHGPPRPGDVRDSLADISAARAALGFAPAVPIEGRGLQEYMEWVAHDPLTLARLEAEA